MLVTVSKPKSHGNAVVWNTTTNNGFIFSGPKLPSYLIEEGDTDHILVTIPEEDIEMANKMIRAFKATPFVKIDDSGNYYIDVRSEQAIKSFKRQNSTDIIETRNKKLAETDWTQLADVSMDGVTRGKWNEYRRQLRDLPTTGITYDEDFFTTGVTWPIQPSP
jgi:hypothetical protein